MAAALSHVNAPGQGPGVITADGCAAEVYRLLPAAPEAPMLAQLVPAGGSVLDLGAGTGRLAHALRDLGLAVTAVDESAAMLAQIRPGVTLVRSNITSLRLKVRYDLVLLASYLVNTDDELRRGLLDACRRHVADTGTVVVQRHPPVTGAGRTTSWPGGWTTAPPMKPWRAVDFAAPATSMSNAAGRLHSRTRASLPGCSSSRWPTAFT